MYFLQKDDIMLHFTLSGSSDITGCQCLLFWHDSRPIGSSERRLQIWTFGTQFFTSFLHMKGTKFATICIDNIGTSRPFAPLSFGPTFTTINSIAHFHDFVRMVNTQGYFPFTISIFKNFGIQKANYFIDRHTVQVNRCQKLLFLQNMGRTCCVQKLFWMSKTISVHNMFSPMFWAWDCHVLN